MTTVLGLVLAVIFASPIMLAYADGVRALALSLFAHISATGSGRNTTWTLWAQLYGRLPTA